MFIVNMFILMKVNQWCVIENSRVYVVCVNKMLTAQTDKAVKTYK